MRLEDLIKQLEIRFNTEPKKYEKEDFGVLIKVLRKLLVGIFTNEISIGEVKQALQQYVSELSESISNLDNKVDNAYNTLDTKIDIEVKNLNTSIELTSDNLSKLISSTASTLEAKIQAVSNSLIEMTVPKNLGELRNMLDRSTKDGDLALKLYDLFIMGTFDAFDDEMKTRFKTLNSSSGTNCSCTWEDEDDENGETENDGPLIIA